jgi:hypothetical protein
MYQIVKEYPKCLLIFPMAIKYTNIFPPKFAQIGIFGLKINHLATLEGVGENNCDVRRGKIE